MLKTPIDTLSAEEKTGLLMAIEKQFLVEKKAGIVITDYKTKWWDLYLYLMDWIYKMPPEMQRRLSNGRSYNGILLNLLN